MITILLPIALAAAAVSPGVCPPPEPVVLTARDGQPLHVIHYRPRPPASTGVVLIHDWGSTGAVCWGEIGPRLCEAGFEVLVPDLREHGMSATPGMLHPSSNAPTRAEQAALASDAAFYGAAFSDSVRQVIVAGVGWGGALAARVATADRPVTAVAWIGPQGDPASFGWRPPDARRHCLLLVATSDDAPSSRVAETLYARFNGSAELRLYSRGAGRCALLAAPDGADGLLEWVQAFAPGGARP